MAVDRPPRGNANVHIADLTVSVALANAETMGLDRLDAEYLLLRSLQRRPTDRAWLRAKSDTLLTPIQSAFYQDLCKRRRTGEPLAYITGSRGFYGLELAVDARVLDPRPDTETLVDWALDVIWDIPSPHVLDLGTGSGAVALAIQHHKRDAEVWAIDASADALEVARANAVHLGLPIKFVEGSWLTPLLYIHTDADLESQPNLSLRPQAKFDLIVSNPPYIAEGDPHLTALVHEPIVALTSGPDGLRDIRLIVEQSPNCLKAGGWLLLEHGYDQAQAVATILQARGFTNIQARKDLAGIERCTCGQWLSAATCG